MNIIKILFTIFLLLFSHLPNNLCAKNKKKSNNSFISENTTQLDKESFIEKVCDYKSNSKEWKYIGDKPAIIDFYADWCGPCKLLTPRLEDVAASYKDSIYVYKVNIDEQPELAAMFNIRSIPTLLFIPMINNPQTTQGLLPKETIEDAVQSILLKKTHPEEITTQSIDNKKDNSEELDSNKEIIDNSTLETNTSDKNQKTGFKRVQAKIVDFNEIKKIK